MGNQGEAVQAILDLPQADFMEAMETLLDAASRVQQAALLALLKDMLGVA